MIKGETGDISHSNDRPTSSKDRRLPKEFGGRSHVILRNTRELRKKTRRDVKTPASPTPRWDNSVAGRSGLQIEC